MFRWMDTFSGTTLFLRHELFVQVDGYRLGDHTVVLLHEPRTHTSHWSWPSLSFLRFGPSWAQGSLSSRECGASRLGREAKAPHVLRSVKGGASE